MQNALCFGVEKHLLCIHVYTSLRGNFSKIEFVPGGQRTKRSGLELIQTEFRLKLCQILL